MSIKGQQKVLLKLINEQRVLLGRPELVEHPTLQAIAKDNVENLKRYGGSATHQWYDAVKEEWVPIYPALVYDIYGWTRWKGNCVIRGVTKGTKAYNMFRRSAGHWAALIQEGATQCGIARRGKYWSVCLGY